CERGDVYANGPKTLVFLGTSRVLTDISMRTLARELPDYAAVQLGVDGRDPAASLRDFANDDRFHGIVVCEMSEHAFEKSGIDDQQDYVRNFHDRGTLDNRVNRRIASFWQSHLTVVNPLTSVQMVTDSLIRTGRLPRPSFVVTLPDRSQLTDYSKANVAEN